MIYRCGVKPRSMHEGERPQGLCMHTEFVQVASKSDRCLREFKHLGGDLGTALPLHHLEMAKALPPPDDKIELDKDVVDALTSLFQDPYKFRKDLRAIISYWDTKKRAH